MTSSAKRRGRVVRVAHLAGSIAPDNVPLYRRLARDPRIDLTVLVGSSEGIARPLDARWYGGSREWDDDLTSGYRCVFLRAAGSTPALASHFWSVRNWDIVPVLVQGRYDVVWLAGYNAITYVLAALTQRALGGEVVFREDQTLIDPRSAANMIAKQLTLRPLLSLGRALYTSSENRRWFQHFGVPDDRLFAAPHSVDNEGFQRAAANLESKRDAIRAEFGIAEAAGPVILTVSRLAPEKQPLVLLEAFRRARQRERCVLLVVGSGREEQALRERVESLRIPDVVFAGFLNRSEIAHAYAVADAFALLSRRRETFGLVVSEAMNFGLPIVVSDRVGCARDLVSSDHNGFVVSATDPQEAAIAIERLAGDPDLRARMGAASLARINEHGIERTADGVIDAMLGEAASRSRLVRLEEAQEVTGDRT